MPASTFVGGSIDIHVRFEALGGNARRAQIFRRHEDLQREYEHQVKAFARETRHVTSKLSRIQSEHMNRMKAIQKLEPQTFREEWPPLEERRAIAAQMQDGLPLLVTASSSKQGPPSKTKDSSVKKPNGNKPLFAKANPSSPKPNKVLSNGHRAQRTHPKTHPVPSQKLKVERTVESNQPVSSLAAHGNLRAAQELVPQEQKPPVIVVSPSGHQDPAPQAISAARGAGVSPQSGPAPVGGLHPPGNSPSSLGLTIRDESSVSSNRGPRRRGRGRHPWIKHENVLLFKVEAREGKEKYTQVAQRKYPSLI